MTETYRRLRSFLTNDEYDNVIEESFALEEDLKFFQMYINRNKKSNAIISLNFRYAFSKEFFHLVDTGDYSSKKIQKTIMEYKILCKLFYQIENEETSPYSDSDMLKLYDYFDNEYEIRIENIADSFIDSNYLGTKAMKKLHDISQKWLQGKNTIVF